MNQLLRNLILFLIGTCLVFSVSAQVWSLEDEYPLELNDGTDYAQCPDTLIKIFQDDNELSFNDIQNKASKFLPIPSTIHLSKGGVYWLKVKLHNKQTTATRYLLEVDRFYWHWAVIDIYIKKDSISQHIKTGNTLKAKDKPIRDTRNFVWVIMEPGETQEIFVRFESVMDADRGGLGLRIYDRDSIQDFEGFSLKKLGNISGSPKWPVEQMLYVRYGLEYVIDTQNIFSLADLERDWDEHARYYNLERLSKAAQSVVWCRHKIINPFDHPQQHFFAGGGDSPEIELFFPEKGDHFKMMVAGKKVPMSEKTVPHPLDFFDFTVAPLDTIYVYLKYYPMDKVLRHKTAAYGLGLFYMDPHEVLNVTRKTGIWKGLIIGIFIFQFIYFALRSFLEKDLLGYYYSIFILGFLLVIIYIENSVNTFFAWQILWDYNHVIFCFSYILSAVGIYFFTNRYLHQKDHMPWAYRIQGLIVGLIIISQIAVLIQESTGDYYETTWFYQQYFFSYTLFFVGCFLLLNLTFTVAAFIKKQPHALSYLLAFGPLYTVGIMNSFQYAWYGEFPYWQYTLTYLSVIVSTILFAIIVAKRNNEMKLKEVRTDGLIQLNTERSRFYSNITHEFRTPLTAILGLIDKSKNYFSSGKPDQFHDAVDIVQRNANRLLNLVNQMLDISKIESGSLKFHIVHGDVIEFLKNLLAMYDSYASSSNLTLLFESNRDEFFMDYDPDNLQKIVTNLISNSIKFTDNGEIKLSVKVLDDDSSGIVEIQVRDTGIGISEEHLPHIFNRYYQVEDENPQPKMGSGIGMALVKELIDAMEGEINIRSRTGKGTEVTIILPVTHNGKTEGQFESKSPIALDKPILSPKDSEASQEESNNPIVLLIEDNPDILYYLGTCLHEQYQLINATDGEEGISKAIECVPDIIISDVMMPKKTGFEVCEALKQDTRTSHIPIILLTAKAEIQDKIAGIKHGADAYLIKPFNVDELLVQVENLIRSRALLIEKYKLNDPEETQEQLFTEQESEFLQNLDAIITEDITNSALNVDQVCEGLSMSRTQLHRKIKALTGKSITAYVRSFRLKEALKLIKTTSLNIQQIAYETGFGDASYFHRSFVKEFDKKPTEFRK